VLDQLARVYQCSVADLLTDVYDHRHLDSAAGNRSLASERSEGEMGLELADPAGVSATLEQVRSLSDGMLGRREFLVGAGAVAAAAFLGGPAIGRVAGGVDLDEVLAVQEGLTSTYWRLEGVLGPRSVLDQARSHHRQLETWMGRIDDHGSWRQMAQLSADASILLAWLHFDLDQHDRAMAVYRQTLDLGEQLDDVDLQAFVVGRMSRTLSECGRHDEARTFADMAERIGEGGAAPIVRSWLSATGAYVDACRGDERRTRDGIDRAAALLEEGRGEPPPLYLAFYREPTLRKWEGHSLLRLAEHHGAGSGDGAAAIDRTLALWPAGDVRSSGEVLSARASAHLAQREVDEAAAVALQALEVGRGTRSARILRHVAEVRDRMTPYRQAMAVQELDEHLLAPR
jgi:tetratricopeptide (TPR) repeat protein